jgi:hypothetical protein
MKSNRFTVTISIFGAKLIELLFVAFYFDLHSGHKYLLSLTRWSTEQNCFSASEKLHSGPLGRGTLKVNVSSKVSDL